jgi:hypothetical protein
MTAELESFWCFFWVSLKSEVWSMCGYMKPWKSGLFFSGVMSWIIIYFNVGFVLGQLLWDDVTIVCKDNGERIWCTWAPVHPLFLVFWKFKISYFYVSKNYEVKYIERYIREECMQKSPVKKYIVFWEIQKRQISDKKIYYCTLRNLCQKFVFFVFPKV